MVWTARQKVISEREHQVNGQELRAFEPIGAAIAGNLTRDQHGE